MFCRAVQIKPVYNLQQSRHRHSHHQCKIKRSVRMNSTNEVVNNMLIHNSAIVGEYLGLFVLFAATLNWMSYRRIRKMMEDDKK